jgi:hypothetical protein
MDLDNVVGTSGPHTELGWILHLQGHLLPRLIVEGVGLEACATVLLVDDHLAMVADECKVSKEGDVQDHVAVESRHTGRSLSCAVDRSLNHIH